MHGTIGQVSHNAITARVDAPAPQPPVFKRRWWYSDHKHDGRPVLWSIENRPQDWEALDHQLAPIQPNTDRDAYYFRHKPSKHVFRVFPYGRGFSLDDSTRCGCSHSSDFQWFHAGALRRAYHKWTVAHGIDSASRHRRGAARFQSHFVPT